MVIDAAKGVETQTRKLFAVCRLRRIPVLTLINKMDLPGRPPLDLMTEVEQALNIHASAINWPIGSGSDFVGIVTRADSRVASVQQDSPVAAPPKPAVDDADLADLAQQQRASPGRHGASAARSGIAGHRRQSLFTRTDFSEGEVTPVFFASALTNFGIESFLDAFVNFAPLPRRSIGRW